MITFNLSVGRNKIAQYLNKLPQEFNKSDIIRFVEDNNIEFINLRYVAEDLKLKTVNFIITNKEYLENILSTGERIDGSSVFSDIKPGEGDLYIIPRYDTAYVNPFEERPTIDILCSFFTKNGIPLAGAYENILKKAVADFEASTSLQYKVMGELEFYIIGMKNDLFQLPAQKGYHASSPFSKYEFLRKEAMFLIAECGGHIKYGHAEVGCFEEGDYYYEQHEIEFLPIEPMKAVEELIISKWILRMLGQKHGLKITFAPKILNGQAGSGLHFHMLLEKHGHNIMTSEEDLSDIAKKMIAGILNHAPSLTAFGNTVPISFLRLVKHQEAPTRICWGYSNRAALIRIPLGWVAKTNMLKTANPQQNEEIPYIPGKQTIEYRAADSSANIYMLIAGLMMAAKEGINDPQSLSNAKDLFIGIKSSSKDLFDKFASLPGSCTEAAMALENDRNFYESNSIFPVATIDNIILKLKNTEDINDIGSDNKEKLLQIIDKYLHLG